MRDWFIRYASVSNMTWRIAVEMEAIMLNG